MARQAIAVPNYMINSLIACCSGAEDRVGNSRRFGLDQALSKMRHHLAREQQHRRLGLGAADHAEIHLQRRALEAADATVITLDGAANLSSVPIQAKPLSTSSSTDGRKELNAEFHWSPWHAQSSTPIRRSTE